MAARGCHGFEPDIAPHVRRQLVDMHRRGPASPAEQDRAACSDKNPPCAVAHYQAVDGCGGIMGRALGQNMYHLDFPDAPWARTGSVQVGVGWYRRAQRTPVRGKSVWLSGVVATGAPSRAGRHL